MSAYTTVPPRYIPVYSGRRWRRRFMNENRPVTVALKKHLRMYVYIYARARTVYIYIIL